MPLEGYVLRCMQTNAIAASGDAVEFLIRLARALHSYGTPTHQIEDALDAIAARLGVRAQFLATPTSIMMSQGPTLEERVHLVRVQPGDQALGRLAAVHEVARGVARGDILAREGTARLEAVETSPPPYRGVIRVLAMGVSSAAASRFLGGGLREIWVTALIG